MTKKKYIRSGLISGLVFALIMAGWDFYKEQPFSVFKFALHWVLFAAFNGYLTYRRDHKKLNK